MGEYKGMLDFPGKMELIKTHKQLEAARAARKPRIKKENKMVQFSVTVTKEQKWEYQRDSYNYTLKIRDLLDQKKKL